MVRWGAIGAASILLLASVARADRPEIDLHPEEEHAKGPPADVASGTTSPSRPAPPRTLPFVLLANGGWYSGPAGTHAPFGADLLFVIGRRLYLGAGMAAALAPLEDRSLHHEGWFRPALRVELHALPDRWLDPWIGFSGGPRVAYLDWYEGQKTHRKVSADLRAEAGLDFRLASGSIRWILGPSAYFGSDQERALVARAGIGFY